MDRLSGHSAAAVLVAVVLIAAACTASEPPRSNGDAGDAQSSSGGRAAGASAGVRDQRACPSAPPYPNPPEDRPRYAIAMRVLTPRNLVTGRVAVRFRPDRRIGRLVFRLWPNGPHHAAAGARLETGRVTVGGRSAPSRLSDPTTLVVPLTTPVEPGDALRVSLPWRLTIPGPVLDRISRRGDSVRLGSFFPLLAWEPGAGWATDPPTTALSETSSSPTADFRVRIGAPPGVRVLATGRRSRGVWRAQAVRDFAVALGRFRLARATAHAPEPVQVTVGVARGLGVSPHAFLDHVVRALEDLARRYGAYPWTRFSLAVMPDLGGAGIEYPAMVFQGPESLERATTHEVGHSWFYSLVGNNQARDPWLDEGITSWAQARGDGILRWFRRVTVPAPVRGRLGEPMSFWERHEADLYAGVYVQGVHALSGLGPPRLVDCALRLYVARNAYGIARPRDLVAALERVFPDAAARLRRFGVRT